MRRPLAALASLALLGGCATTTPGVGVAAPPSDPPATTTVSDTPSPTATPTTTASTASSSVAPAPPAQFGNPAGRATVPAEAKAEDTSKPTRVIGDGTPGSCTSQAVVSAVAAGGVIAFSCGPAAVTITMTETAKVKAGPKTVLDGGGRVTLSGGGKRQILVMDVPNQSGPQLVLQNLSFTGGNSATDDGGGAVYVRGGKVKVVNSRFYDNRCAANGPDLGGAGLRVNQARSAPVHIVGSTFEDGTCANGGALSGLHVTFVVLNSVLRKNKAVGRGANPARAGTPGGGSGGAIYTDGDKFTVRIAGSIVEDNHANEGGGAVFFVSNDRTGSMTIEGSVLRRNRSDGFETIKGIFYLGNAEKPTVSGSTIS
ncbi:hypothetical protein [Kibdelosporangium aridum]|uniref:hypothetical protein n=1 Tax=Kibdelosporangium aridum TaxID=2030 RepID=UPI0005273D40